MLPSMTTPHHPPARRPALPRLGTAGELLYLSAMLLAVLWAAVLLFVVYPSPRPAAAPADEEVPVVSPEGALVTVPRARLAEALRSGRFLPPSEEQSRLFAQRRAELAEDARRARQLWYLAAALFPGLALLLLRAWWLWWRRT
jgi:hypothetical protein